MSAVAACWRRVNACRTGRGLSRRAAVLSARRAEDRARAHRGAGDRARAHDAARGVLRTRHLRDRLRRGTGVRTRRVADLCPPVRDRAGTRIAAGSRTRISFSTRWATAWPTFPGPISAHRIDEFQNSIDHAHRIAFAALALLRRRFPPTRPRSIACARSCARRRRRARSSRRPSSTRMAARMQSANGTFELSRPGKFRWNVEKPYKQLLVGDGQRVWVYRRGPEPGDRAQGRRRARRHAGGAAFRQPGRRARVRVEGPAGGGRPRLAGGDAARRRMRHSPRSAWASMPRVWPRSKSSTRSARRASCASPTSSAIRNSRRTRSASRRPRARTSSATQVVARWKVARRKPG